LRHLLNILRRRLALQEPDQLQRLVEPRRDAAAGEPVAVEVEAGMARNDSDLGKALGKAGYERPMGRRRIAVEKAGGGQQQSALADRGDNARVGALLDEKSR